MMQISLICVGRLKERFYEQACDEYLKRLSPYCKLSVVQLPECGELDKEADAIRRHIAPGSHIVALCIEGKTMASDALAQHLNTLALSGRSRLAMVIGSSSGLSEKLKTEAHLRLSMSPMTFPHHLARVMTLEQLYRSFVILEGGKYHK